MTRSPSELELADVFDFVDLYLRDRESGRPRSLLEYLQRFPRCQQEIAREFLRLEAEGERGPDDGSGDAQASATDPGRTVGPYHLLRVLGGGGQATVYLAEDRRIGRQVALKVLPPEMHAASRRRLARFRREAEIVAGLNHPRICTVLEADTAAGVPYIAMRHVTGRTLATVLADGWGDGEAGSEKTGRSAPRTTPELHRLLHLVERVARALHTAHEAGVVHRDIKPGNIMVTPEGEPVILDFGLARHTESGEVFTLSGEVLGTLAYMSPEQVRGGGEATVDRRSDVYSLGATLYECVTCRQPFTASTRQGLIRIIETAEPPDPRTLNPALPEDIAVVLAKAMDKNRERRYATALEFAEDLRRIRDHEPIAARPVPAWLRLRRWARHHPALSTSIPLAFALLCTGLAVAFVLLARVSRERERFRALYTSAQALHLAAEDPTRALRMAVAAGQIERSEVNNNALLSALRGCRELAALGGPGHNVTAISLGPGSGLLAAGEADGTTRVWTLDDVEEIGALVETGSVPRCLDFDTRGERLAIGDDRGAVRVWRPAGHAPPLEFEGHSGEVVSIDFSPDGRLLATAALDGTVRIWDLDTGRQARVLRSRHGAIFRVRFLPGSGRVLTWSGRPRRFPVPPIDRAVRVWNARTGEVVAACPMNGPEREGSDVPPHVADAAIGPGGKVIAFASTGGVSVWRPGGSDRPLVLPDPTVTALALHPDGHRLATCSAETACVWDTESGEKLLSLAGHDGRTIWDVAFSPDGSRLATAGLDGTARIWNASTGDLQIVLRYHADHVVAVAWGPDGRLLVTRDRARARVWSLSDRPGLRVLRGHRGEVRDVGFDPLGRRVVTAGEDGRAAIWDVETGRRIAWLQGPSAPVVRASFGPLGVHVLAAWESGTAALFGAANGRQIAALGGPGSPLKGAAWSRDGHQVLTWYEDGTARVWPVEGDRAPVVLAGHGGPVACGRFSPDGRRVVTGAADRTLRLWNAVTGKPLGVLWRITSRNPRLKTVFDVAYSSDGRYLAAACQDEYVRVFATDTWRLVSEGTLGTPGTVSFGPAAGFVLATGLYTPRARTLRVDSGDVVLDLVGHTDRVNGGTYGPRGRWILTFSNDGTARLWKATGEPWMTLAGHEGPVLAGAFSPDGRLVVTGSQDGTARIWPVDPLPLARQRLPRSPDRESRR